MWELLCYFTWAIINFDSTLYSIVKRRCWASIFKTVNTVAVNWSWRRKKITSRNCYQNQKRPGRLSIKKKHIGINRFSCCFQSKDWKAPEFRSHWVWRSRENTVSGNNSPAVTESLWFGACGDSVVLSYVLSWGEKKMLSLKCIIWLESETSRKHD